LCSFSFPGLNKLQIIAVRAKEKTRLIKIAGTPSGITSFCKLKGKISATSSSNRIRPRAAEQVGVPLVHTLRVKEKN
jgi:hypothetical protein